MAGTALIAPGARSVDDGDQAEEAFKAGVAKFDLYNPTDSWTPFIPCPTDQYADPGLQAAFRDGWLSQLCLANASGQAARDAQPAGGHRG